MLGFHWIEGSASGELRFIREVQSRGKATTCHRSAAAWSADGLHRLAGYFANRTGRAEVYVRGSAGSEIHRGGCGTMVFGWLRNRRRRRLKARPFPPDWEALLRDNACVYRELTPAQQAKVRDDIKVFVAEKNWEGCGGLVMSDEIKLTIAAQIAILVLGFSEQYFDNVLSILVYPDAFIAPNQKVTRGGVVLERESPREGEAWYRGPVILSWADVLEGSGQPDAPSNLVFHEFAHQLDMLGGSAVDGCPPLDTAEQYRHWNRVMRREYRQLVRDCRQGHPTVLSCYGATSLAEFFAVATEAFFQRSHAMLHYHEELYWLFRDYYRQDPAARRPS